MILCIIMIVDFAGDFEENPCSVAEGIPVLQCELNNKKYEITVAQKIAEYYSPSAIFFDIEEVEAFKKTDFIPTEKATVLINMDNETIESNVLNIWNANYPSDDCYEPHMYDHSYTTCELKADKFVPKGVKVKREQEKESKQIELVGINIVSPEEADKIFGLDGRIEYINSGVDLISSIKKTHEDLIDFVILSCIEDGKKVEKLLSMSYDETMSVGIDTKTVEEFRTFDYVPVSPVTFEEKKNEHFEPNDINTSVFQIITEDIEFHSIKLNEDAMQAVGRTLGAPAVLYKPAKCWSPDDEKSMEETSLDECRTIYKEKRGMLGNLKQSLNGLVKRISKVKNLIRKEERDISSGEKE
ncbi:MAG: hypothetical protein IJX99_04730 [Clostridia bacterium]|nr:hypothetical protein [Clostridia bacterium]